MKILGRLRVHHWVRGIWEMGSLGCLPQHLPDAFACQVLRSEEAAPMDSTIPMPETSITTTPRNDAALLHGMARKPLAVIRAGAFAMRAGCLGIVRGIAASSRFRVPDLRLIPKLAGLAVKSRVW
ncbi:MAG: hypothetical protein AAF989_03425 [Planctomycetota bacterium]